MSNPSTSVISIPYPEAGDLHLRIGVGACRLRIVPGEGDAWVAGSYDDPSGSLPYRVTQEGGTVRLSQERNWSDIFNLFGTRAPRFELRLGNARSYMLTIETGASESSLDLGGLPISRFEIKTGAGKMDLDFSAPNPQTMSLLNVSAGATAMEFENLANANFSEMFVEGGAASYRFDFGGTLRQNAHVRVSTGVSSVDLRFPAFTAAKITPESMLGGVDIGDGYTKKEGAFWTEAAVRGETPVITVRTNVALGSLAMRIK
jgi:hypothetical protein